MWSLKREKRCLIPQRFLLIFMIHLGIMSSYLVRVSFEVVLIQIIKSPDINFSASSEMDYCNFTINKEPETYVKIDKHVHWDRNVVADVYRAFFFGYLIGHFPGGYIADKYGGKHVFGLSVLLPGLFNLIIPVIFHNSKNGVGVVVMRLLIGMMQGATFPAAHALISNWGPRKERGALTGIVFSASQIGTLLNNFFTMEIIRLSWFYVFYIYGGISIAWWFFWLFSGYNNPTTNPFIGNKELIYLREQLSGHVNYGKKTFPCSKILLSVPVWCLILAQVGHTWIWHSLLTELPMFMMHVLRFDIQRTHLVTTLPYGFLAFFTISLGFTCDYLINRGYMALNPARKTFTTFGAMGPGIFVLTAAFCGCDRNASVVLFCLAMGLMSCYYAGTRIVALDLAPNYSGCIMAMANGLGAIQGIIQPTIFNIVISDRSLSEWRKLFLIAFLVLAATNFIFVLFGTAHEQYWNQWDNIKKKMSSKIRRNSFGRRNKRQNEPK